MYVRSAWLASTCTGYNVTFLHVIHQNICNFGRRIHFRSQKWPTRKLTGGHACACWSNCRFFHMQHIKICFQGQGNTFLSWFSCVRAVLGTRAGHFVQFLHVIYQLICNFRFPIHFWARNLSNSINSPQRNFQNPE